MNLPAGAIRLRGVSRSYRLLVERNQTLKETLLRRRRTVSREVVALRDIDLDVTPGTGLGVVGANGAGKSTLLKVLAGILPAEAGTVEIGGKVVSLLELGAGFHPDFTGRENVILNASIHGMTRREIESRLGRIIDFSELEPFIDAPVRTYSSGMYTRLGFAVAAELDPDVLLLDEVLAVGDAAFQGKCLGRIAEFQRRGVTIVFVSHSAGSITTVCNRAIWLSGGRIQVDGEPDEVLRRYHQGLVAGADHEAGEAAEIEDQNWKSARIRSVRCTEGGVPSDRFLAGAPFAIEVDYEVVEDVTPLVGVTLTTVDGHLIGGIDNRVQLEPAGLGPGRRTARFELPSLPLQDGRFAVSVSLEAADGGFPFHQLERCSEFTVFAQGRGHGPVRLDGDWTVSATQEALSP